MMHRVFSRVARMERAWQRAVNPRWKLNHRRQGVINFIDVGSIDGLPQPWVHNANRVKFLLNFEPNDAPSRGPNHLTYNTALWESEATLPFYIYKGLHGTGSSLFEQNFDYVRENFDHLKTRGPKEFAETWFDRSQLVKTLQLRCRPLDAVLAEALPGTQFHFMKVDAQGAEHQILKGAKNLLATSCVGLHLELFTIPLYKGITLLPDVEEYLRGFGFRLAKKFPPHGTFDSQHDCLFLKETGDPQVLSNVREVYEL